MRKLIFVLILAALCVATCNAADTIGGPSLPVRATYARIVCADGVTRHMVHTAPEDYALTVHRLRMMSQVDDSVTNTYVVATWTKERGQVAVEIRDGRFSRYVCL